MHVLETFIEGKEKSTSTWEDGFLVTDDLIIMIDGESGQVPFTMNGTRSGRYMMEFIRDRMYYIEPDISVETFLLLMSMKIKSHLKDLGVWHELANESEKQPTTHLIIYNKKRNEIWHRGNGTILINDEIVLSEKNKQPINWFDEKDLFMNVIKPIMNIKMISVATDGYEEVKNSLTETEEHYRKQKENGELILDDRSYLRIRM